MPVLAGNTRDEGKLFPPFLPLVGGASPASRLDDATRFTTMQNFNPDAATTADADCIIDPAYLPVDDAGHRLRRA